MAHYVSDIVPSKMGAEFRVTYFCPTAKQRQRESKHLIPFHSIGGAGLPNMGRESRLSSWFLSNKLTFTNLLRFSYLKY